MGSLIMLEKKVLCAGNLGSNISNVRRVLKLNIFNNFMNMIS